LSKKNVLFVDFTFYKILVVLADEVVEPVVKVGAAISAVRVEKVTLDAISRSVAALSTDGIDDFRIVERLTFLPLPRAASILLFVVETRVDRFAARLDKVRLAAALAHCYFARSLV